MKLTVEKAPRKGQASSGKVLGTVEVAAGVSPPRPGPLVERPGPSTRAGVSRRRPDLIDPPTAFDRPRRSRRRPRWTS